MATSLPAADAIAVHVHAGGETIGPMSRYDLKEKLDAGELQRNDRFWYQGQDEWLPIDKHPELFADLGEEPAANEDDRLDGVFGDLVNASWAYHGDHDFADHVDEVFLGAIITSTLDAGYALIDLTSDGTHHYLRFENLDDNTRVIVRFTHLTPDLATAKVLGQRGSVIVGYGEKVSNFSTIYKALKAEYKSGLVKGETPGTISVDGDMSSGYVYVQVPLYLCIDDYVRRDYAIDNALLTDHFKAAVHALRKYLRGRMG